MTWKLMSSMENRIEYDEMAERVGCEWANSLTENERAGLDLEEIATQVFEMEIEMANVDNLNEAKTRFVQAFIRSVEELT